MGIFDFILGKKGIVDHAQLRQWAARYASRKGSSPGISAVGGGDYTRAIQEFTTQINQDPGKIDGYLLRGMAYALKGEVAKSIKDVDKANSINSNSPEVFLIQGFAMIQKKDREEALKAMKKTVALDLHGRGAFGDIAQNAINTITASE